MLDEYGCATFGNWTRKTNEDGLRSQRGNTKEINYQIMMDFQRELDVAAPWRYEGEEEHNPHSLIRNGMQALLLYIDEFINNQMCQGYSIYHSTSVYDRDIDVCEEIDEDLIELGVEIGQSYFYFDSKLILSLTGDGASGVKNTPSNVCNLAIAFLKVFLFEYDLLQCRHAGICVLLSSLGDSDTRIVDYIQRISYELGANGTVKVWSTLKRCWFIFDYVKYTIGDWAWQHKMNQMAVTAAAEFAITNAAVWNIELKKYVGLSWREYYVQLKGEHIQPYQRAAIAMAQSQNQSFKTLTTNRIAREWGEQTENKIAELKSAASDRSNATGAPNPWNNKKYENTKRTSVSRSQQHGITGIGESNTEEYDKPIFDVDHNMWAINLAFLALLVMLMWTVWGWNFNEVQRVAACIGVSTITSQICAYMESNKSKNSKVWPEIHITGTQSKLALHGLGYALKEAADIAYTHEMQTEDDTDVNYVPTLLIAVIFRLYTLMRRGFGILFTHRFEKPADGSRHPLIQEMIDCILLATFIACNLLSVIVSI